MLLMRGNIKTAENSWLEKRYQKTEYILSSIKIKSRAQ